MKQLDDYFADWESVSIGYGYGTGEEYTIRGLKDFMNAIPLEGAYNYQVLEGAVGALSAWLFISILCHADVIEYGTSPRFGWLTEPGRALQAYLATKSATELQEIVSRYDEHCFPDHCNCEDEECHNPFWRLIRPRSRNSESPPAQSGDYK